MPGRRVATTPYESAVEAILDRRPEAEALLRASSRAGPSIGVAEAALAWMLASTGRRDEAADHAAKSRASAPSTSRPERHHVEILLLAAEGSIGRASGLAGEHLAEFPDDRLIAFVARWVHDQS